MNTVTNKDDSKFYNELLTGSTKQFKPKKVKKKEYVDVTISPSEARYILKNFNSKNRKPSKVVVTKYATDMESGAWKNTGDLIRFDKDGNLLDGQHRLLACIQADLSSDFTLVYGLDPDVFDAIDNGKIKTNADILNMMGYSDPAVLSALARSIIAYEETGSHDAQSFRGVNQITRSQVTTYIEDNPNIVNFLDRYKKSQVVSSTVSTFCYWLLASVDAKKAEKYLDMVFLGQGLGPDTIEYYLFNKLQRNKTAPQNKMTKSAVIANVILGWRRYTGLSQSKAMQLTWDASKGLPSPQ